MGGSHFRVHNSVSLSIYSRARVPGGQTVGGLPLHSPQLGKSKHIEPEFQMTRQCLDSHFTVHNSVSLSI